MSQNSQFHERALSGSDSKQYVRFGEEEEESALLVRDRRPTTEARVVRRESETGS
jgi:hypothetical protein